MPRKPSIPHKNKSPTGWWVFGEIEQWIPARLKKPGPRSRCLVWENLRLVRARNREEAYRKAVWWGRAGDGTPTPDGVWRFAGLSLLLPVYDSFEGPGCDDGSAEVLWTDHGRMSIARMRKLVVPKNRLSVFDDSSPSQS